MAKVVGDVAIAVGGDASGLVRELKKAGNSVKGFERNAESMSRKVAKIGVAVAASAAAMGAGFLVSARNAAASAKEIQNLSRLAGVGAEEFQKLAIAGEEVGFSQEKMADIFKDVNDKFGDFLANGAGPLKDFFENIAPAVGVTAEQFANLSGPEALQLYVSSLEKANVSQQQMTFYLEALASDATALAPLLRNNGQEIKRLGDEAQNAGRIISSDLIDQGVKLDQRLRDLSRTIQDKAKVAILEYADEIEALAAWVAEVGIPALVDFGKGFADFVEDLQPAIDALRNFMGLVGAAAGVDGGSVAVPPPGDQARFDAGVQGANALGGGDPSNSGAFYVDENGEVQEYGVGTPEIPGITAPQNPISPIPPSTGSGRRGGGGGGGLSLDDFEAFQERLATEAELLDIWREEQMEKLQEFRDAKIATDEEYNQLEQAITREHADALKRIEQTAQEEKFRAYRGALGDLSALLLSENDKLFKVGKAAAIAQAILDGHQAATSAWRHGMTIGGPPLAAAFTAASLAKTGALIAGLKSASPRGTSGGAIGVGGSSVEGSGVAASSEPVVSRNIAIQVEGQNFTRSQVLDLINELNSAVDDGAIIRLV